MVAALVMVMSIAGLAQFAISYWRSMLANAAAQAISEDVLLAVGVENREVSGNDFAVLRELHRVSSKASGGVGFVRFYHGALRAIALVARPCAAGIANWAEREMTMCSQYVGFLIDQRLQADSSAA